MKKFLKESLILWGGLFVAVLIISVFFDFSIPTDSDAKRASELVKEISAKYPLKYEREDGGGPAIYCSPHPEKDLIYIYGRYDSKEIDSIRSVIEEIQDTRDDKRRIEITFCERELDRKSKYFETAIK